MEKPPECRNRGCSNRLIAANSARSFLNPSLAVKIAVENGIISPGQSVLEIGSGNMRNSAFILRNVKRVDLSAYEIESTIQKYPDAYRAFKKAGGALTRVFPSTNNYDAIICTFVLETICPGRRRTFLLKNMRQSLKSSGILIASFRGYSGVYGTRYKACPTRQGWLTPLYTFIKPYSIKEIQSLLKSCGFMKVTLLQGYRVDTPKNIHLVAS